MKKELKSMQWINWSEIAREEARVYDIIRSLFFDLHKDGEAFNMRALIEWVRNYQKAAEIYGYPLSEREIKVIPEMLRIRFVHQFIWLLRWDTMKRISSDAKEFKFLD